MGDYIAEAANQMTTIPYKRASLVSATQRISTCFKDDIGNFTPGIPLSYLTHPEALQVIQAVDEHIESQLASSRLQML